MCPGPQIPVSHACPPEGADVDTQSCSRRGIKITQHFLNGSFSTYHGYGALRYPPEGISYEYPRDADRPISCDRRALATGVRPAVPVRPELRLCQCDHTGTNKEVQPAAQVTRSSPPNPSLKQSFSGSQNLHIPIDERSGAAHGRLRVHENVHPAGLRPGGSDVSNILRNALPHVAQRQGSLPRSEQLHRPEAQEHHGDEQLTDTSPTNAKKCTPPLDGYSREKVKDHPETPSGPDPRSQPGSSRILNTPGNPLQGATEGPQPPPEVEPPQVPEDRPKQGDYNDEQPADAAVQSRDDAEYDVQPGVSVLREVSSPRGGEMPPRLRKPQYHAPTEDSSSWGTSNAEVLNADHHLPGMAPDLEPLETHPPRRPSGFMDVPGPVSDPARHYLTVEEQIAAEDERLRVLRSQAQNVMRVRDALQRQVLEQTNRLGDIHRAQDAMLAAQRQHPPQAMYSFTEPVDHPPGFQPQHHPHRPHPNPSHPYPGPQTPYGMVYGFY